MYVVMLQIFCLCEDSGYLYRFLVYTGAQDPARTIDDVIPQDAVTLSKTEKTVVFLALPLLHKDTPSSWIITIHPPGCTYICTTRRHWHAGHLERIGFHEKSSISGQLVTTLSAKQPAPSCVRSFMTKRRCTC